MLKKIARITIITLIAALCVAVVIINPERVTVYFGGSRSVTAMGGVIFLGWFVFGLLVSLYLWCIYGIQVYFRERSFRSKEYQRAKFFDEFLKARALFSAGEYSRSISAWNKLIQLDPTNIVARVELSKVLEASGDARHALKVLDKAREIHPSNIEVLLAAARINEKLGNKTAALDNFSLVLYQESLPFAAAKARDLSIELQRIEDALEYQQQLETVGGKNDDYPAILVRFLSLKRRLQERDEAAAREPQGSEAEEALPVSLKERADAYRRFIKQYPNFIPAITELSALEEQEGRTAEAAEVLLRAAKENKMPALWRMAIDLWLKKEDGERALSAARTALRNAPDKRTKYLAQLESARVHLLTGLSEKSLQELTEIAELEQSEDLELRRLYLALTGYSLNQRERFKDAAKVWKKLLDSHERGDILPEILQNGHLKSDIFYPALQQTSESSLKTAS